MDGEGFGFIHGELDIKILILFILRRLPRPVDGEALTELTRSCDNGVGWFDYAECLAALVESGHIDLLEGGRYIITEKGVRNGSVTETSIPYSVRAKAERLLEPLAQTMRRDALISTGHVAEADGVKVLLSLSDGKGEILSITMLAGDEKNAAVAEANFRRDAEGIFKNISEMLMDTGK